jgi:aminoglycoside phosphotransferase (APT) family kinase protein
MHDDELSIDAVLVRRLLAAQFPRWADLPEGYPVPWLWRLPPGARAEFRSALDVDGATWARGRGWALSIALIALPYYHRTNPALAAVARYAIDAVLAEHPMHERAI